MRRFAGIFIALLLAASLGAQIPTPKEHFGFAMGEDRKLATWEQLVAYYRAVDAASDRVLCREIGRSTEDRPFLILEITSPENAARRDELRALQKKLATARFADENERSKTVESARAVVYMNCNMHSTEIASSLMVPELVYDFATSNDPKTLAMLDQCVLLIAPSANPDGIDIIHDWYARTIDTPWEGTSPPILYQKYVGHDNNRDWFMLSQIETRLVTKTLYDEWFPAIVYDVHQMGNGGARYFVPPFTDPVNPNLDPLLQRQLALYGTFMTQELSRHEKTGVIQGITFDNWWNGGARNVPYRHNMIGILSEAASAKLATPVYQELDKLKGHGHGLPEYKAQTNFPDPWPGGWWRMRDIIDYELISIRAILTLATKLRTDLNSNYALLGERAIRAGIAGSPYAWIIPPDQRDRGAARRLLQNLRDTGVEIHRATADFSADGISYPKDSIVILAAQAYRAHVKDLLERQAYPEIKASDKGEIIRPYDNAGWTLPLQFGVTVKTVGAPFKATLAPVTELPIPAAPHPEAPTVLLSKRTNDAWTMVNRLLREKVEVSEFGDRRWPFLRDATKPNFPDAFVVRTPTSDVWQRASAGLSVELSVPTAHMVESIGAEKRQQARVGIYKPWTASMDEGWTRFVFETHEFETTTIDDATMRAADLSARFTTIVIPSISARSIRNGHGPADAPKEFQGGIGKEGTENLAAFVKKGGRVLFFGASTTLANEMFDLGLVDETDGDAKGITKEASEARKDLSCPGSILAARFDERFAAVAGIDKETPVFYAQNAVWPADTPGSLAWLGGGDPLLSGYLRRPEVVAGRSILVERRIDEGSVVLFGYRPQNRGQPLATFKTIFAFVQ